MEIDIDKIVNKHYDKKNPSSEYENRKLGLRFLLSKEISDCQEKSEYPLSLDHICFKDGHAMNIVYSIHHERFAHGKNKCGRCGHEESWQYDF